MLLEHWAERWERAKIGVAAGPFISELTNGDLPMSEQWCIDLDQAMDASTVRLVNLRRYLHAHPEVSGKEHETSLYLYQMLVDEGFDVRMGPDGRGLILDSRQDLPAAKRSASRTKKKSTIAVPATGSCTLVVTTRTLPLHSAL